MKQALSVERNASPKASQTVSSVPGRIRIRDKALCNALLCSQLAARLSGRKGVVSVETNARAGSIAILYDPQVIEAHAIEASVDAIIAELQAARPVRGVKSTPRKLNRAAKAGMIGSLATSMALAAAGNKRWHAATGAIFLCCLGVHLAVHRRHLLR